MKVPAAMISAFDVFFFIFLYYSLCKLSKHERNYLKLILHWHTIQNIPAREDRFDYR